MKIKDQLGRELVFDQIPQRIVSLVPSQTELLFDLGLQDRIVGRTKFCIHPRELVQKIVRIGGTKKFNFELIDLLQPDFILANKEENYKEGIERLENKYKVWISDVITLEDAQAMILSVGQLFDKEKTALQLLSTIRNEFEKLESYVSSHPQKKKVLYLIWQDPMMVAGNHTFIQHILEKAGWINAAPAESRYPVMSSEEINASSPDFIFLSSEPFPFKEKHIPFFQQLYPCARVLRVDGELFSWYGSRLQHLPAYLISLIKKCND